MAWNFLILLLVILDPPPWRVWEASHSCCCWVIPEEFLQSKLWIPLTSRLEKNQQASVRVGWTWGCLCCLCSGRAAYHLFGKEAEIQEGWCGWREREGTAEVSPRRAWKIGFWGLDCCHRSWRQCAQACQTCPHPDMTTLAELSLVSDSGDAQENLVGTTNIFSSFDCACLPNQFLWRLE